MLAYRAYAGHSRQVAVLIHGSAGQSVGMNMLARTLNNTGATLVFPKGVARPNSGGWATVSVPRIGALICLNWLGIHRLDGLPAVNYAAPPDDAFFTLSS